jgi:hypothetical protein
MLVEGLEGGSRVRLTLYCMTASSSDVEGALGPAELNSTPASRHTLPDQLKATIQAHHAFDTVTLVLL